MSGGEELLNIRQVAQILKVSPLTVKRYIYSGKLPSVKTPGGQHRVRKSDLEKVIGKSGGLSKAPMAKRQEPELMKFLQGQFKRLEAEVKHLQERLKYIEATAPEIKVLGIGCRACDKLTNLTYQVLSELGLREVGIRRLKDIEEVAEFGPLATPALVVGNKVLVSGKVPSKDKLSQLLKQALN